MGVPATTSCYAFKMTHCLDKTQKQWLMSTITNCAHFSLFLFIETLCTSYFSTSIKIHLSLQEYIGKITDLNPSSRMFLNKFNFEQTGTPKDCRG